MGNPESLEYADSVPGKTMAKTCHEMQRDYGLALRVLSFPNHFDVVLSFCFDPFRAFDRKKEVPLVIYLGGQMKDSEAKNRNPQSIAR
jgi:hypothetical protein